MKVFCFPPAGGSAAFFLPLEQCMAADVKLVKLEYAGHGTRLREAFYGDFEALTRDLYDQVLASVGPDEAYAFFGYSLGSIAGLEVLRRVLARGESAPPVHMFLAAHEPHAKRELAGLSDGASDAVIRERTLRFGGVPEKLIGNSSFWRVYLPVYRHDYALIGQYDFEHICFASDIPATVFYSQADTPLPMMQDWRRIFTGACSFVKMDGSHFFIYGNEEKMARIIQETLAG